MTRTKSVRIVVAALLVFGCCAFFFGHRSDSPLPFNGEIWKKEEDSNERLRMVGDLKPKLMGISKADVEQLLGAPSKVGRLAAMPDYDYVYLLGTDQRLLDTDGIWLCIKFENGRVNDVQVLHGE